MASARSMRQGGRSFPSFAVRQQFLDQGDGLRRLLVTDQAAGQGMARFKNRGEPCRVGELGKDSRPGYRLLP